MSEATLRELLARVEAATGPDREVDALLWLDLGRAEARDRQWSDGLPVDPGQRCNGMTFREWIDEGIAPSNVAGIYGVPQTTGSLDAAMALVERMLPGSSFTINSFDVQTRPHRVRAVRTHISSYAHPDRLHSGSLGAAPTEALALLAALLGALISRTATTSARP